MRDHWECTPQYDYRYLSGGTEVPAGTNIQENIVKGQRLEDSIVARQVVYSPIDSHYPGFMSGTCESGQLTERGMAQARLLGKQLREIYVDKLKFLPNDLPKLSPDLPHFTGRTIPNYLGSSQPIYVRTMPLSRMRMTAQGVVSGLYPRIHREENTPINLVVYPTEVDVFFRRVADCPRRHQLVRQITDTGPWKEHMEHFKLLEEEMWTYLRSYESGFSGVLNGKIANSKGKEKDALGLFKAVLAPRTCLKDAVWCTEAGCLDQKFRDQLILESNWRLVYKTRDSPFSKEYTTLGQKDLTWVQYTSQLIFEYWDTPSGIVVRALYNGRPVVSTKADFSSLPLEDFQKLLESYIPKDFGACQVVLENSGGPRQILVYRCSRARVQALSKRLQGVWQQVDHIVEKELGPILPWFTITSEMSSAESLHQNCKKVENTFSYASELLLRMLKDMDRIPLRSMLDPIDPLHSTGGAPAEYQPLLVQDEALQQLMEKRRTLAGHINEQLAEVDEYHHQYRSLVPPEPWF
ncbi:hypothetical protein IWQ61_001085 [Dispira simplex]|nr:hypothetical protein IWQ61_001085 [Dispira simplex]